jgi:hypothetical protein
MMVLLYSDVSLSIHIAMYCFMPVLLCIRIVI